MSNVSDSAADAVEAHKEQLNEELEYIADAVQKVDNLLPIAHSLDEAAHKIEVVRTDANSSRRSVTIRFTAHFQPEDAPKGVEAMRGREWDSASMSQTTYRVEQEDGSKEKFNGYRLTLKEEVTY